MRVQAIGSIMSLSVIMLGMQNCAKLSAQVEDTPVQGALNFTNAVKSSGLPLIPVNDLGRPYSTAEMLRSSEISGALAQQVLQQTQNTPVVARRVEDSPQQPEIPAPSPTHVPTRAPSCSCTQVNTSNNVSLAAGTGVTDFQVQYLLNNSESSICGFNIPSPTRDNPHATRFEFHLTGELTKWECSGSSAAGPNGQANAYLPEVPIYSFRAPEGCAVTTVREEQGRVGLCFDQSDADRNGVLSVEERNSFTSTRGLVVNSEATNANSAFTVNTTTPADDCVDAANLYFSIALTGQNNSFHPGVNMVCRQIYFAAGLFGHQCYENLRAQFTGEGDCPELETFSCVPGPNGCQ